MQLTCSRAARLSPLRPAATGGFTVIELMVTLTLLGILLALAAPAFGTWINNTRVRTVSNVLQDGVRLAQAEAVRRNRTVVFFLTSAEPSVTATAAANAPNWGVRTRPLITGEAAEFLRGGALSDVAAGVTITGPATLCFGPSGQRVAVAAVGCTVAVSRYTVSRSGSDRNLRIDVSIGGRVRMCDPARTLSATQPDGCEA